jgi:3-oxoacyl-[acyl-carrier protein] reductase
MEQFLDGKKALVTGGTKGIGFEIARALLASGAHVLICGRASDMVLTAVDQLRTCVPRCKVYGQTTDVSSSEQVRGLFEFADRELNGLDILVNNAGSGIFRPAAEISVSEWDRVIGTNLSGAFYCSREALSRFQENGRGWIINISSLAGRNPMAGGAAYNASKFGMNGMTEAMMLDHRQQNVKVSYVMPGSVDTEFGGRPAGAKADWKIAPEDIAEIVLDILRKPERTLVSRVEVRPARPPQKESEKPEGLRNIHEAGRDNDEASEERAGFQYGIRLAPNTGSRWQKGGEGYEPTPSGA